MNIILDFDLAELYGVKNEALKQAVKRNIKRFPSDFMIELAKNELVRILTSYPKSSNTVIFYRRMGAKVTTKQR